MRSYGDVPRASSYGGTADREPGSDVPQPSCSCGTITLAANELVGLDDAGIAALIAARCTAAMHFCEAWPERRRERQP